jgi:outer membrane lipoprotein-sorting protein
VIKSMRLLAPLALLLALSVVLSACSAGQPVTAAEVITKMRETMKTTQTSQAVVDLSLTINKEGIQTLAKSIMGADPARVEDQDWTAKLPDSVAATIKTWRQAPDKARVEVDSSTLPGLKGATLVHDGTKVYAYSPSNNTVYTATPDKLANDSAMPAELKGMLQGADIEKELDKVLDASDIKLAGTEKVAGIDAYKLEIAPKPDAAEKLELPQMVQMQAGVIIKDLRATLWVDKDRWIPLKLTLQHPNIGQFTAESSQVELNKPIDASQFVLQVPAGAKTVDLDAEREQSGPKSMTISEARDAAAKEGWKLLEPSYVPDNATLVGVLSMPAAMAKQGGFMLNYQSPKVSFSITQGRGEYERQLGDGFSGINMGGKELKEVQVRGVTGKAFSPAEAGWTALFWQEKDSGTWVAIHGKLSLDEALKVAESLK